MDANSTPEISLIVPVYNVEKYLRQALDSILEQTFTDWECIVVDDGAKDNCPAICDEYGRKDPRFRIIHKPNGGLSSARNAALPLVRGKYVGFIDSDDWLDKDYLKVLYNLITKYDADVAQCGFWKEYTAFVHTKNLVKKECVLDRDDALVAFVLDKKFLGFVWNKLFKREIISSPFPEGKVFEDIYTLTEWFKNLKKAAFTPTPVYHYRMRKGSIMHSNFAVNVKDYYFHSKLRAETVHDLCPDAFPEEERDYIIYNCAIKASKSIARKETDKDHRIENVNKIGKTLKDYKSPSIKRLGFKYWCRGKYLKNSPRTFISLMRLAFLVDFHSKYRDNNLYD